MLQTNIAIDNTPPVASFHEIPIENGKVNAQIRLNESVRPIHGWTASNFNLTLSKEFSNSLTYALPLVDLAGNSSDVLVDIKKATCIAIDYTTYDDYSNPTFVSNGKVACPNTVSSGSICKSEAIFIGLSGTANPLSLQGKAYVHTYWGNNAQSSCRYSELRFSHGYNPSSTSEWWTIGTDHITWFFGKLVTELGGFGVNLANNGGSVSKPIPSNIASQYLYGISSVQFKLKNNPDFSVVYQCYVKDIGWLKASFDGEEHLYRHDKPISSFRINIVPKSEKQYLIDFWNRNVGTNSID